MYDSAVFRAMPPHSLFEPVRLVCPAAFRIEGREYIFVSAGASGADGNTIPHIQDAVTVYNRVGAAIEEKMNDNNK